jgi:hypothetical protein
MGAKWGAIEMPLTNSDLEELTKRTESGDLRWTRSDEDYYVSPGGTTTRAIKRNDRGLITLYVRRGPAAPPPEHEEMDYIEVDAESMNPEFAAPLAALFDAVERCTD